MAVHDSSAQLLFETGDNPPWKEGTSKQKQILYNSTQTSSETLGKHYCNRHFLKYGVWYFFIPPLNNFLSFPDIKIKYIHISHDTGCGSHLNAI